MLKQNKSKIILDTNILIYMYENKKDVIEIAKEVITNAQFYILNKSYEELEKVFKNRQNKLRLIKLFLKKLENLSKFEIINVEENIESYYKSVDRILIYYSKNYIIYTSDKILRKRILAKNGKVLILKKYGVAFN